MNKWLKFALGAFVGIVVINLFLGLVGGSGFNNMGYTTSGSMMNQYGGYSTPTGDPYNGYYQMPMYNTTGQSMPMQGRMGGMGMRGMGMR